MNKEKQPEPKVDQKVSKVEEILKKNPGLRALLAWSERHHDQHGGYGH